LDVAPLPGAAGLIDDAAVAGQRDAEGVRVLSGLAIVGEVDRVPVTVHTVDRGAAREVAARGGGARAVDGDARRLHLHAGGMVDVVQVDGGREAGLEPRIEAEVAMARPRRHDPATAGDEVLAGTPGRTRAVDVTLGAR